MRTIRRLYFYAVALISLEVVLWGLIILLRSILAEKVISPGAELLAQALALILVGVPIFALHWLWCQRAAAHDEEERSAMLRAIFLYAALLAALIPVVQNTLALFDQLLVSGAGLEVSRAVLGAGQSWKDNLIAMLFNGVAALYFLRVARADGQRLSAPDGAASAENFAGPRRLYRYIWVLYGLLLMVFGLQQVLSFLLYAPSTILGAPGRELLLNGLALAVVGAPLWAWRWSICQQVLVEPGEQASMLRLGVLYLLALGAVATVLTSAGLVVDVLLRLALGESLGLTDLLSQVRGPLSIGLPLAGVWAYYGVWLGNEIKSLPDALRRAAFRRFYFYLLSAAGLAATFIGLSLLLSFLVDLLVGSGALWGDTLRPRLAGALATLLVGMPLWLLTWRPMQAEALAGGDAGDHARRSLVRKIYLYLAIFATLIGAMVSGGMLAYQLLVALLNQTRPESVSTVFNLLQALALFIAFLAYHFVVLRRDGGQAADASSARHAKFAVLVFEQQGSGFAALVGAAIHKAAGGIPVALQAVEQGVPAETGGAQAVVLSSALALDPPEALRLWLKEYAGQKIILPVETPTWFWPGGVPRNAAAQAAQIVRQLADGQEVRPPAGTAAWQVVAYICAVLFALQLAFFVLVLGISLVMH
jgi:hypothetical protein